MRFFAVILLAILTISANSIAAQDYQKSFAVSNVDTTYTGFTPLQDSGIAIITVANKINSEIKVIKLDKNGNQNGQVKFTLPTDFNCETYRPVIIEDEQGALVCSFSYSGTFNMNGILIFKLSPTLNLLWNKYIPGTPMKQYSPMARCGKKYFTVTRLIKNDPSGLNPKLEFGYTLSCFSTNGDHVWSKTFLSDSSNYYENLSVFANSQGHVVVTSGHGTIPGLNGNTYRFTVFNEVDTNGTVIQTKATSGILPGTLQPYGNNQYLITGRTSNYPFVGILNSDLQSVWMRQIAVEDNACIGTAYATSGFIYFHTSHIENGKSLPCVLQISTSGTMISAYVANNHFWLPYSAKPIVGGKHAVVACNSTPGAQTTVSVRISDTAGYAETCPSLLSCPVPVQNISLNVSDYTYKQDVSYAIQEFSITTQNTSIGLTSYCNPIDYPNAHFVMQKDTVCAGELVSFIPDSTNGLGTSSWLVTGPTTYSAQSHTLDYAFMRPGIYTVKHTHHLAFCEDTFSRTIVVIGQVAPATINTCDTVFINQITSGCQITWPNGSHGNYYIPPAGSTQGTIQLICGECTSSTTTLFIKELAPRLNPASLEMCAGGEVTISYPGPEYVKLVWSDGFVGKTRTLTQPGIYYIDVTGQQCSAPDSLRIKEIKPDATFALANDTFCANQPFDLLSLPELNDQNSTWKITGPEQKNFNAKDVKGLMLSKTGTYIISHKHTLGNCINTYAQQLIIVGAKANTEAATCDTLYAADISTTCAVQWPDGSSTPQYVPSNKTNPIPVTVTCNGCTAPFNINVDWLPHPALPNNSIEICENQNYRYIIPYNYAHTAVWQDGTEGLNYPIDTAGVYIVNLTKGACKATDTLTVTTLDCNGCTVYIPNAFTPNNDYANDIFTTYTNCPLVVQYQLQVYNRFGEKVFESLDEAKGWNGEYKGSPSPPGVYVYVLQIVTQGTKDFETKNYKGSFTLLE